MNNGNDLNNKNEISSIAHKDDDKGLIDSFEKLSTNDSDNDEKQLLKCVYCSKEAKHKCNNCGTMYCSVECQKRDWNKGHKKACKTTTTTTTAAAASASTVDLPFATIAYSSLTEFLKHAIGGNKQTNLTFFTSPDRPKEMYMAITEDEKTEYFTAGTKVRKQLSGSEVTKKVIKLVEKGSVPLMVSLILRKVVSQSNPNPSHQHRKHHHSTDEHYFISAYMIFFGEAQVVRVHKFSPEDASACLNTDSQTGEQMPIPEDETYI